MTLSALLAAALLLLVPLAATAAQAEFPAEAGDVFGAEEVEGLRDWFPKPFYQHRKYFFYPGMAMEIGPPHRDYSPPALYQEATKTNGDKTRLGTDGALVAYHSGQPFPVEGIQCATDPDAGTKLIWNFVYRWEGFGIDGRFRYTYWDRGEKRPLIYQGLSRVWYLKHRPEPRFARNGGDVFKNEKRAVAVRVEVEHPPEVRGTRTLTYRYESSLGPLEQAQPEDTWVFVRDLRRVRKISEVQRTGALSGTDFAFDDLFSFSGVPPQYGWKCLGETEVLAPMNTRVLGYPYREDEAFGPSGLSHASDRWELRRAFRIEMVPKDPNHPYSRKEIWLDRQTFEPLYSFAYDRGGVLWKIIYHLHRWSEDDLGDVKAEQWYRGWEGVPRPRDLRVISEAIVNVQTGSGNRIDFWDSQGTPPRLKDLRRAIDLRSLSR
jgi:hypothetical protein